MQFFEASVAALVMSAGDACRLASGVGFSHFFWRTLMKKILLLLGALALAPAFAQTSVGVSVGIYQPGVYGRIDIGNFPQPRVVYPEPVVILPSPVAVYQRPVYLYVPPGHQKNWGKYCGRYNACGQPVYFVQEEWVRERYEERRGHQDNGQRGNGKGHGKGHGKG
ncbi:MAG: hypothetical protein WB775_00630, partial [Burkholderiaceae bacterium]